MDSHKVSVLPERLTVVELGRRRRWSEEEKLRIVMESLAAPRLVSAVARRHGITRSLLSDWRRTLKVERIAPEPAPVPAFVPAVVVSERPLAAKPVPRRRASRQAAQGRMVIEVGRGRRVVVDGAVDAEALARVLDVLDRR
ncbi:IS66-like element accessory protein TnpA [Lichenibacterium dinghuense]|uniref:IS66-like element accessory protein TnpA n=1 Tax=Lichenibacterium dinghuense TaxID=2895977 RepID=UPI001F025EFA|nr:transposase [Lichenibacterium sp. 6Y81]